MEKIKVLDLSLKFFWYDMIERGEKREEYRDFTPYYANRLLYGCNLGAKEYWETIFTNYKIKPWFKPYMMLQHYGCRHYDAVRFHRGQGSPVTMLWEYEGLEIDKGKPEWGAPEDKDVFIIKLGRRL